MTKQASFRTTRGAEIVATLVTERVNNADHNFSVSCWDLVWRVNGELHLCERIDHPQHGPCITFRATDHVRRTVTPVYALIPAERVAAIDELIAEYKDGLRRRWASRDRIEALVASSEALSRDMDNPHSDN